MIRPTQPTGVATINKLRAAPPAFTAVIPALALAAKLVDSANSRDLLNVDSTLKQRRLWGQRTIAKKNFAHDKVLLSSGALGIPFGEIVVKGLWGYKEWPYCIQLGRTNELTTLGAFDIGYLAGGPCTERWAT